ncbi:MAG: FtsQ-type POTRA domain-containing protein [Patescibacteria group bacterium]
MKRSFINSPSVVELKRKRYKVFKTKIIICFFVFLILVVGLSLISRIDKLNIDKINVSGNKVIETKDIKEIANKELVGNYLWLFPKTNFLIYPQNKIKTELMSKFKRIKNVFVNDINIKTLEIYVSEYEGKYLYCGEITPQLDSRSQQKCYFMDSNGYIFDEAPFFSGDIYFKFYGLAKENNIGNYFNPNVFTKLIQFKESLIKMDLKPLSIWVNNENEIYVNLSTLGLASINPSIIFKLDSDYEKIAENLQAAITTEPLKGKLKNNYASLHYIDLRFGNKVYYKFAGQ